LCLTRHSAGKTTLLSILTGVNEPTTGQAYIAGLDIVRDADRVKQIVGICPQHDVLWEARYPLALN